jgi:hypothetical protein
MSSPELIPNRPQQPETPRRPFDVGRAAFYLLAALVACGIFLSLMVGIRCTFFGAGEPQCAERQWGQQIRDWIETMVPILIAIIMRPPRD